MKVKQIKELVRVNEFLATLPDTCIYAAKMIRRHVVDLDPGVIAHIKELRAFYECYASVEEVTDTEIKFNICKTCDDRTELLEFAEKHGLTLPDNVTKSGNVYNGKTYTNVLYIFEHEGVKVILSYQREGLPTRYCRVVTNTSYDVACDVSGNNDEEGFVP